MKTLHTFTSRSHRTWPVLGSLLLSILLLVLAVAGLARAAAPPDPADQLRAAWERARDAGYQFEARVEQTLFPLPVWSQWGHSEEQVNFYLEGELERLDQPSAPGFPPFRTRTRVWPEVGRPNPLVADAVAAVNPGAVEPMMEIVQEGDKATVRQAGQEARTVQIPTGLVAPQGDYLAYLEAARDVEPIPDCPLPDGACYRFRVDGPTFARVLRDRTERQYAADLPPNVHLAPSPLFQQMTGQGELWVDTDGFPVRQVLDLEFPQVSDDYGAKAHVVADFSPDKETRGRGDPETKKRGHAEFISPSPHLPIFAFALLLTYSLVRYRRRKRVYATIVLLVITSMLGGPLYSGWRMNRFFRMRTIEAAESGSNDERRETADEGPTTNGITDHAAGTGEPRDDTVQAFFRELERAMEPNGALPGHAVGEQPPGRDPRLAGLFRQTLGPEGARLMAQGARDELPPGGCYQGDLDSDGDGLCDGYETDLLGTDDTEADTDRDLITDTLEVEGFPYAGKTWYTNPLVADSNRDGLTDYAEWPEPVGEAPSWDPDGDNLPNVWDDDNDGDGVIDRLDISPWSYSAYIARGDRYSLDVDAEGQAAETLSLEFQVQPQDSTHLRYAMRTLDWPNYDDKGQIMDLDASVDDLTLIPMLEVLASAEPQNASEYAISVVKNPDNATKSRYPWKLYAPITVDDAEGRPAAFHAKMVFQGGATIQTQSRLVWLVQAKDDTQIKEKGVPGSQVIHIYDDDFRLAGLKVSRHGSTELALLGTPHEEDNGDVAMLLLALSQTFLLGREDLTLEEVERRFQSNDEQKRWGITTTVRVIRNAYPHMDAAIADTIANTAKTLLAEYNTSWRPALLVAYEDKVGFAGLDDLLPAGGGPQVAGTSASFDLDAATMMTLRGLKLNQYQYTTQGWVGMELGEMLADLDDRYGGDSDVTDELLRSIKLLWMAWVQGLANVVRAGAVKVSYPNILEDDVIVKEFRGWVHKLKGVVKKIIQPKLFWEKVQGGYGKLSKFIKNHPRWSTAIAITVIVLILVDLYFKGVGETMKHVIMGLSVAFAAYGLAEAAKKSGGFLNLIKGKAANLSKAVVILNVIILVVEVVLIWYAFFSATANVSGPAYYMALSLAIGMTILAVALFVLSFFGIGQVVSLLLAIADFIGSFFGVNVSNWIAGYIGKRYLTVKVITTLDPDSIDFKSKEATWQNPAAGAVPGNELTLRAELKGMIVPKGGGSLEGGGSLDDAFNSNLQGSMVATGTNDVFAHADGNIPTKHKTSTGAEFVNETNAYFKPQRPGVDLPADLAVQVNYTILYRLGHGCELGYCAWWEDAKKDSGSATSDPSTIYLDVLPSTVSGLWTWSALTNPDPDGDGLTTTAEQAQLTDPNNTDTDGDGLDDGTEVRLAREGRGTDPRLADSDNDGLNDREEIVLGTRADNPDTDGDGLSDGGERAGYMMDFYGLYPDAWAWPDPFKADADRDGLTDSQEFALKTNPNAGAYDLNAWIYATAGYVQPGATVTVSVVGVNFTGRTDIKPHIQVRLPPTITPTEFNVSGRVRGDGEYSWSWTPMVVEPDGWRHWTIMAPVAIAPGAMFTVTAVGRLDATLAHGTVVTFTSSLTYAKSPTETFWAGDMGRAVVDRIRPTSAILDPTDGAILRGQAYVVGGTAADPDGRVQKVEVSADGGHAWDEAEGQGAWNWTWELPPDGDYALSSRATDHAGWQEDHVTGVVNVTVDNTAPETTLRVTHPGGDVPDGGTVRLEPTDGAWVITATGQVRDDVSGAPTVAGVGSLSLQREGRGQEVTLASPSEPVSDWQAVVRLPSGRPEGEHWFTVWATDQVGNVQPHATTVEFTVDNTPPTVDSYTPLTNTSTSSAPIRIVPDELGRYRPLPTHQPLRGNVDTRSGRVSYRALNPADLNGGPLVTGDFNGDDLADLAVGAPAAADTAGIVYLIFGKAGPWLPRHNLNEADAWLVGPTAGTRLGRALANAGDLNGDGADDLIIGAADGAYVSFGRDAGWRRGEVLDASDRLLPGRATLVSGGGDLDGDGDDDAVVAVGDMVYLVPGRSGRPTLGAPLGQLPGTVDSLASHPGAGVMAGSSDGNEAWLWIPVSTPTLLPRSPSAIISAARGSKTPSSVGYAGDVNGDGSPDWLIGDGRVGTARVARLFCGRTWTGGVYDDVYDATAGFRYGTAGEPALLATGIGDVNADGYDDIIVGFGTTAWVMHGRSDPETWGLEYDLANADATISHLEATAGGDLNCDGSAEAAFLTDDGRLSLFFGQVGDSCALTPAGLRRVEIGLGAVTDPSAPLTATLPAQWLSASPPAWQSLDNVPANMGEGGRIAAWDGHIWTMVGDGTLFFAYNPRTNAWERKADLPEKAGGALAAGGDGYLYAVVGHYTGHFYRYNTAEDQWERRTDIPVETKTGVALTGDGAGYLYLITGNDFAGVERGFYRYDIATNNWERRADVPERVSGGAAVAWTAGAVYAFPGSNAFYRYDLANDSWTALTNAPGAIGIGGSLVWDGGRFLYALRGWEKSDFYRYDLKINTWEVLTPAPAVVRQGSALAWLDGYLYATRGNSTSAFWRTSGTWYGMAQEDGTFRIYARPTDVVGNIEADATRWAQFRWRTLPEVPEGVGDGGRLATVGDRVYVATGNMGTGFYAFDPSPSPSTTLSKSGAMGAWQRLADTPRAIGLGSDLADAGDGRIYLLARDKSFWRYDIAANAWTQLPEYPGNPGEATAIAGDSLGTLYVLNSNQSRAFYQYTPAGGWKQLADAPAAGRWGSALTVVHRRSGALHVYALRGWDRADFWRYDSTTDTWEVLPDIPGSVGSGGALAWACTEPFDYAQDRPGECDGGAYIYAFRGQASRGFYRYHISEARWEILPDAPATVHEGGSLAWSHGGLYILRGKRWDPGTWTSYATSDFWRWDGLVIVDRTPPEVTWEPTETQVTAPSLVLTARVTDTVAGVQNVAFEVEGQRAPATYNAGSGTWRADLGLALPGWQSLSNVPSSIDRGGRIAAWDGQIWALQGGGQSLFYAYDPQSDIWAQKASLPMQVAETGSGLVAGGDGYLYATVWYPWWEDWRLYRYKPAEDAWQERQQPPVALSQGGALAADGAGYLYMIVGGGERAFYRYDMAGNSWERKRDVPQAVGSGGALAWAADALYAFPGNGSNAFYKYDAQPNTWTRLANAPGSIGNSQTLNDSGASLAWDGGRFIYALRGYGQSDFYRYDLHTNTWSVLASTPGAVGQGGALAWLNGVLYATQGNQSSSFWRHPQQISLQDETTVTIRPRVVDRLGSAGYGTERTLQFRPSGLGNIIGNYGNSDIITSNSPPPEGTAVASQGLYEITLTRTRLEDGTTTTDRANVSGTSYYWMYNKDLSGDFPWADGSYDVTVGVKDSTWAESVSDPLRLIVDTRPPAVAFTNPTDGGVITATGRITITGTAGDTASGLAQVRLSFDNTASWREVPVQDGSWQTPWDVPTLDGQTRHLVVEATDRAGWTTRQSIAVTVDNVLPGGADAVTFSVPVGQHIQAGTALQATWSAPSDGSGAVHTFAALDQITDTIATQEVLGTSFSATFDRFGDYYFHLSVQDTAGNRRVAHYGPWHAWYLGSPPQPQYTIIVDGQIDLEHAEWLPEFERLGQDERSGWPQELFLSWDTDDVFLGWRGAHIGVDGDLVWLFDTMSGGTPIADLGFRIADQLPFEADFFFTFRHDHTFALFQWDGVDWFEVTDSQIEAASSSSGDVEARIPRSLLQVTGAVRMLALARRPDDGPVWAVLPDTNPLEGPWTVPYSWDSWVCEAGDIAQASVLQQVPCPLPAPGQPDAGLTWLRLTSPQPSGLYLPVNGTITYALVAGNATDQPADETRLTLTGDGVVFEAFSGPGTCSDCPAGGDTWTVDLGTLPPQDQVAIAVTARTLDTNGATVPVTTTAHLTALLPDADPGDNVRSLTHLVDGTPPTVAFVAPLDGDTILPGPQTVVGTAQAGRGDAIVGVEVSTDGVTWRAAQGRAVWTAQVDVPTEGTLTVYVRAIDEPGNVGPPTAATFIADGVAPVATITPPEGVAGGESLLLTGTAFDLFPEEGVLEEVEVRVDDGYWIRADGLLRTDGDYDWHFRWSLPEDEEGVEHRIAVRAVDAAGSVSEPSAPVTVVVDTIAPTSEIAYPADGTWLEPGTTQVLVWGWSEDGVGVAQVRVSLDAGLTWADAVVADEEMGDGRWRMEDGTVLELPSAIRQQLSAIRHQPSARLWAFAGTLPEDEAAPLILARATDVAGNVERPGPAVQLHRVVSRLWLPLTMKNAAP